MGEVRRYRTQLVLAVGGMIEQDGVTYIVLPGPPSELKAMFSESLLPFFDSISATTLPRVSHAFWNR